MRNYNKAIIPLAKKLRKDMTREESHLWYDFLRKYPIRFQRQKTINNYIADFYCARAKLVIEIDGSRHYETEGILNDKIRTQILESYDFKVVRISNSDVNINFQGVCDYIDDCVKEALM